MKNYVGNVIFCQIQANLLKLCQRFCHVHEISSCSPNPKTNFETTNLLITNKQIRLIMDWSNKYELVEIRPIRSLIPNWYV